MTLSFLPQLLAQESIELGKLQPPADSFNVAEGDSAEGINALFNLESLISSMIGLITVAAGLFFIVQFLLAAFSWITAGGDSGKLSKARDQMVQATIGLIIIVAAYGIVGMIGRLLGVSILSPAVQIKNILYPGSTGYQPPGR